MVAQCGSFSVSTEQVLIRQKRHLDTGNWKFQNCCELSIQPVGLREAASNGQLDILQWLRAQISPCPWSMLVCATDAGEWARAQDPPRRGWSAYVATRADSCSFYNQLELRIRLSFFGIPGLVISPRLQG